MIELDQKMTAKEIELAWLKKRSTRITSTGLKKLNTGGTKGKIFGDTAIGYIEDIVIQIKKGDIVESSDKSEIWQMQFGRDNEPLAFNWIQENFMEEIKRGSTDFGDILFMCVGDHFGTSPDGIVYENGDAVGWIEIKCPANKKKAIKLTEPTVTLSDVVDEYRDQFISHFIGCPEFDFGWYVIYNAHVNEFTGIPYNDGNRFIINRKDFEPSISLMEAKIEKAYRFILLCVAGEYKPEDINVWWVLNE